MFGEQVYRIKRTTLRVRKSSLLAPGVLVTSSLAIIGSSLFRVLPLFSASEGSNTFSHLKDHCKPHEKKRVLSPSCAKMNITTIEVSCRSNLRQNKDERNIMIRKEEEEGGASKRETLGEKVRQQTPILKVHAS